MEGDLQTGTRVDERQVEGYEIDLHEEARRSLGEPESARPNLVSHNEEADPRKKYLFILNGNQRRNRRSYWRSAIRVIRLILQPFIDRVLCLNHMSLPITSNGRSYDTLSSTSSPSLDSLSSLELSDKD